MARNQDHPSGASGDARVRFALSPDGLRLGISRYFPPGPGGRPLTADSIRRQLTAAGVSLSPVQGAPEKAIEFLRAGKDITKIVLVRGKPAQEPTDAALVPEGDIRFPVFPGRVCARKTQPLPGSDGLTIDGRVLKPSGTHKPKNIKVYSGKECAYDMGSSTFTAQVYGLATIKENTVHVAPLLAISEDQVTVSGGVHFRDNLGRETTPELFQDELARLDVALDPNDQAILAAVDRARETKTLQQDVPVVQGRHPLPGKDGRLEFLVDVPPVAGTEDESGRMDYRNRGLHPTAKEGEIIARLHPPQPGRGGIDIFGKTIPPSNGKPLVVTLGQNVEALEDGERYRATAKGLIVFERKVLSVTECLVVSGDVSLGTGNVKTDLGSVKVLGNVQSGLNVEAPRHVVVDNAVENACVLAGGNVEVRGGIVMPGRGCTGYVKAEGSVRAGFCTNGRILAGGDVILCGESTNCSIETHGELVAIRGKGVVQGGEIVTPRGIEVNELGSPLGVPTHVTITWRQDDSIPLLTKKAEIKKKLKKIDERIGTGDPRDILARTPPAQRKGVAEVIKLKLRLLERSKAIAKALAKETAKRRREIMKARIKVWRTIHPGVTLKIAGRVMEVHQPIERSQIYYDPVEREIVVKDLN